jgi:hypothetical protein
LLPKPKGRKIYWFKNAINQMSDEPYIEPYFEIKIVIQNRLAQFIKILLYDGWGGQKMKKPIR